MSCGGAGRTRSHSFLNLRFRADVRAVVSIQPSKVGKRYWTGSGGGGRRGLDKSRDCSRVQSTRLPSSISKKRKKSRKKRQISSYEYIQDSRLTSKSTATTTFDTETKAILVDHTSLCAAIYSDTRTSSSSLAQR